MIKGIIALFSSGIIFRLPILCGIIIGFYMMFVFSDEQILAAFKNPLLYVMGLIICFIYAFIFKRVYKRGGGVVDWSATFYSLFGHFASYVAAVVFSCLFIFAISLGGCDNEDETEQQTTAQVNEIINYIKKNGY